MTDISKKAIEYTLVTQAIENLLPSSDVIGLCEKMSEGLISADGAVQDILKTYGIESVQVYG